MDFLNRSIKPIYFKYLSAAFGSAMISSVYSIVDVAMVGQYQGPSGTAALAVVAPVWNLIYSLGVVDGDRWQRDLQCLSWRRVLVWGVSMAVFQRRTSISWRRYCGRCVWAVCFTAQGRY